MRRAIILTTLVAACTGAPPPTPVAMPRAVETLDDQVAECEYIGMVSELVSTQRIGQQAALDEAVDRAAKHTAIKRGTHFVVVTSHTVAGTDKATTEKLFGLPSKPISSVEIVARAYRCDPIPSDAASHFSHSAMRFRSRT